MSSHQVADSDLVATMAHELRTPLTAVKGFAEFLTESWDTMPDERKLELVQRILEASRRLDAVIQELLDASAG